LQLTGRLTVTVVAAVVRKQHVEHYRFFVGGRATTRQFVIPNVGPGSYRLVLEFPQQEAIPWATESVMFGELHVIGATFQIPSGQGPNRLRIKLVMICRVFFGPVEA
jgi:hypothetical protein